MKAQHLEPPPIPNLDRDHRSAEDIHEERRANQLMVVGGASVIGLMILLLFALVWFRWQPKGIGGSETQVSQGDEVSVMGTGSQNQPSGAKASEQAAGETKDVEDAAARAGGQPSAESGPSGQSRPVSQSEEDEQSAVEESMIAIPSGKISGDAIKITLGDDFNPFLEAATGNDIVYVIDVSGSMDGDRYHRVSEELIEAIHGLKDRQRFNIILFSTHATAFRDDGIVAATPQVKHMAADWLKGQFCGGGTDPSEAMEMAVKMAPGKIVVLSDGEFDSTIPTYITGINQSLLATIDCIGFDPQSLTLKEITASNGPGRFYAVR